MPTITIQKNTYHWYALYTASRAEKKVYQEIQNQGVEVFLPLVKKERIWSDRKKVIEVPLISSYIFAKVSEREYYSILNTRGIVRYVTFNGKAAKIREEDILSIKDFLVSGFHAESTTENIAPGSPVVVTCGSLQGFKGEVVAFKNKKRLIIRIQQLSLSVLIDIPVSGVKSVTTS